MRPSPTPGHFCGICWGLERPRCPSEPGSSLGCRGVKLSNLHVGVCSWNTHKQEHTHIYIYIYCIFWTEPQLVSRWKCFSKVHYQYDATLTLVFVWRPRHSAFALLWYWTWTRGAPRAPKTAGQRCQQQQTRCPAHPRSAWLKVRWSLI